MKKALIAILICLTIYCVYAEDPVYLASGKLDLSNPSNINSLLSDINSNAISIDKFLAMNPDSAQLETVMLKLDANKQQQVLTKLYNINIAVNGPIQGLKDGKISTSKIQNFDLSKYGNFAGSISINPDGSISLNPNIDQEVKINDKQLKVSRSSDVSLSSDPAGNQVMKIKGQVIYEGCIIKADGAYIFFDSDFHNLPNYIQLDRSKGQMTIKSTGSEISIDKESVFKDIHVLSDNVNIKSGKFSLLLQDGKSIQQKPFGTPEKNLLIFNEPSQQILFATPTKMGYQEIDPNQFLTMNDKDSGEPATTEDRDKTVGQAISLKGDRVIIRGRKIYTPDGSELLAVEYRLWSSLASEVTDGMADRFKTIKKEIDADTAKSMMPLEQAEIVKKDLDNVAQLLKKYEKNDFKYEYTDSKGKKMTKLVTLSNIVVREDGHVAIYPRPDSDAGLWGNVKGTPDYEAKNIPTEKVSPVTVRYLFKVIETTPDYQDKDGKPKAPLLTEYNNREATKRKG